MKNRRIALSFLLPALGVAVACGSSGPDVVNGGAAAGSAGANGGGSTGSAASGNAAGTLNLIGSGGDTGGAGTDTCGGTQLAASPTKVNVLLVVDKSSSMSSTPTGFGDTKWNALRTALSAAVDATKGSVAFGLDFFPNSNAPSTPLATVCSLPIVGDPTVAIGNTAVTVSAIKKALTDSSPAGATPTAGALGRALHYFTQGAGASLEGARYVLLATDGGPNCDAALKCAAAACTVNMDGLCPPNTNCCDPKLDPEGPTKCLDDSATVAAVKALAQAHVKTFVVGIPGTEAYQLTLNAVADAGDATNPTAPPSYFAVSAVGGVKALSQVLTNITTGLITTCDLHLSETPPDLEQINVVIDGKTIPEGSADGWALDTTSTPPTVVLKGTTCKAVETTGAQNVEVTFGCPTVHVK